MLRWVDTRNYLGFDRRGRKAFRLINRRVEDLARSPPYLPWLLRQLEVEAANMASMARADIAAYAERVRAVAELACRRKEERVAQRLDTLAQDLVEAGASGVSDLAGLCARHLRGAMMALR